MKTGGPPVQEVILQAQPGPGPRAQEVAVKHYEENAQSTENEHGKSSPSRGNRGSSTFSDQHCLRKYFQADVKK